MRLVHLYQKRRLVESKRHVHHIKICVYIFLFPFREIRCFTELATAEAEAAAAKKELTIYFLIYDDDNGYGIY